MKATIAIMIMIGALGLISCDPPGTITGRYENEDFVFTKIVMPDDREVWVAKSKSPKAATTTVNDQHNAGKVAQYTCVITVDENGNEHLLDKKPVK